MAASKPPDPAQEVLEWMKGRGVTPTSEAFVDLNWGGHKTVEEVLEEPELARPIPASLLPND